MLGMNKKAIMILGAIFILIVGTLGFLIYSKYASKSPSAPPVANNSMPQTPATSTPDLGNNPADIPPQTPGGAIKLSDDQVVSPALFFDGSGITYFDNQGKLYQAALDSSSGQLALINKKQLDIPQKPGITKILWPAQGNDFIAQAAGTGGQPVWSYFSSTARSYTDLPPQVAAIDWLPSGNQIVYVWLSSGKATLNLADPDTKNWKKLADMWETDNAISVSPDGTQLLFYETQSSGTANAIKSVTIDAKIWKDMVKNGFNSGVLWSPDGQKFLFGKKDVVSQQYQLWVYNMTSGEVKNLGMYTTPEKTVWDKDSTIIYAAVPNSGAGAGVLTQDSFFRMDTNTMEKKQYDSGQTAIDGRSLFLNSTSDKLFFKNAQDGGLYYLDLTK